MLKSWRRDKNNDSLAVFHAARNMFLIGLKEKRSKYLSNLISDAKGVTRGNSSLLLICYVTGSQVVNFLHGILLLVWLMSLVNTLKISSMQFVLA